MTLLYILLYIEKFYRKTYIVSSPSSGANIDSLNDIDTMIKMYGTCKHGNGNTIVLPYSAAPSANNWALIQVNNDKSLSVYYGSMSLTNVIITIEYTKNTD